jgi:pimeloyl-ACP methyl ester carboxylesterase
MKYSKILNHPVLNSRYFFPRPDNFPCPLWVECPGARLACAYHESPIGNFTIVHFHGNGEVVADYLDGFPELLDGLGCSCFLAEYRGYGESSGIPQLGHMLDDVTPIIAATGQPHDKLILFGRSVGSLFAIKAVELFPDVAGLILESAIADPLERLLLRIRPEELGTTAKELSDTVNQAINIRQIMTRFTKPALILHTRHDGLIDASHAERLASWSHGPVRLEIFPRGNHNDIMFVNGPRYLALIKEFLAALRT